jgi:hypothetical protein
MNIVSWFSKSKSQGEEGGAKGFVPYEEIDAKKTSKLGYFFLVLMVLFGIWQGNNFLDALERLISPPELNSSCLATMEHSLPGYTVPSVPNTYRYSYQSLVPYSTYYERDSVTSSERCFFSAREKSAGIPALYATLYVDFTEKASIEEGLQQIRSQKYTVESNRNQAVNDYSVSLLESIAKKNQIMDMGGIRETVQSSDDLLRSIATIENNLSARLSEIDAKIKATLEPYRTVFMKLDSDFAFDVNVHEVKRFGIRLLFIVPMFLFVWRRYSSSKNNRSEYSLIWGGVVAIASILLAQVVLVFIYQILPHQLLQKIFAFLSNFAFFFVVLYWFGFILVPLFFGFLIYMIQKKYYNKKAIAMRAFKSNKCPRCTMSVAPHMVFCPTCGMTLKVRCTSCGGNTPNAGDFCELCGTKKVEPVASTP